ncbi:PH domain-like [Phytophthora cactorum]|nr:PH domain-like [Phytophthora cactorum]
MSDQVSDDLLWSLDNLIKKDAGADVENDADLVRASFYTQDNMLGCSMIGSDLVYGRRESVRLAPDNDSTTGGYGRPTGLMGYGIEEDELDEDETIGPIEERIPATLSVTQPSSGSSYARQSSSQRSISEDTDRSLSFASEGELSVDSLSAPSPHRKRSTRRLSDGDQSTYEQRIEASLAGYITKSLNVESLRTRVYLERLGQSLQDQEGGAKSLGSYRRSTMQRMSTPEDIIRQGWLSKRGEVVPSYRKRWVTLRRMPQGPMLTYAKDDNEGSPTKMIDLSSTSRCVVVSGKNAKENEFKVMTSADSSRREYCMHRFPRAASILADFPGHCGGTDDLFAILQRIVDNVVTGEDLEKRSSRLTLKTGRLETKNAGPHATLRGRLFVCLHENCIVFYPADGDTSTRPWYVVALKGLRLSVREEKRLLYIGRLALACPSAAECRAWYDAISAATCLPSEIIEIELKERAKIRTVFQSCVSRLRKLLKAKVTPEPNGPPKDQKTVNMMITKLWELVFPGEPFTSNNDPKWLEIGFQRGGPASDLRSSGLLGLYCLIFFASYPSSEFQRYSSSRPLSDYECWDDVVNEPQNHVFETIFCLLFPVMDSLFVEMGAVSRPCPCINLFVLYSDVDVLILLQGYMEFGQVTIAFRRRVNEIFNAQPKSLKELQKLASEPCTGTLAVPTVLSKPHKIGKISMGKKVVKAGGM